MTRSIALASLTLVALAGTAVARPISFATPNIPATADSLQDSWSATLDGTSPTFRRANQSANGSETAPNAPAALASAGAYRYGIHTFVPATSGLYTFYSAQSFDGYMHLYQPSLVPANALTNALAGDDDMNTLNSGAVPNRNGVTTSNDSGFRYNLTGGTSYEIVTSTYTAGAAGGAYYNEIYGGGTPGSFTAIPDNTPAGVDVFLTIASTDTIATFMSVDLFSMTHTYIGDLTFTLTHVDTGTSVVIMNRPNNGSGVGNNSGDFNGDYQFVDGGAAFAASGLMAPGAYGSANPLSVFAGESLGGTWKLNMSDVVGADTGGIFSFGITVEVPTPGAAALLGLGALAMGRRRRA